MKISTQGLTEEDFARLEHYAGELKSAIAMLRVNEAKGIEPEHLHQRKRDLPVALRVLILELTDVDTSEDEEVLR